MKALAAWFGLASLFIIFCPEPVQAQHQIGREFRLFSGSQDHFDPQLAFFPDGRFLGTFGTADEVGSAVWVQLFSILGKPLGSPILVRQGEGFDSQSVIVGGARPAVAADGRFWILWGEDRPDLCITEDADLGASSFARSYSTNGLPLGQAFRLGSKCFLAKFASVVDGRLFTLEDNLGENLAPPYFISVSEFDAGSGVLLRELRPVLEAERNQAPLSLQIGPAEMSIGWASCLSIGAGCHLLEQRFSLDGAPSGPLVRLNRRTTPEDRGFAAAIAHNRDGSFVAVWEAQELNGPLQDIHAQRVSASGEKLGRPFVVNRVRLSAQRDPSVASDWFGNFVVAWQSFDPAIGFSGWHVRAQLFRKDGRRVGREIVIPNPGGDNDSWNPTAVFGPNGTFLLHYIATGPVLIRRYAASPADEPCVRTRRGVECDTGRTGGEAELPLALRVYPGDVPLLGDVDGDGRADPCVRRGRRFLCDTDHEGGDFESVVSFGRPDEVPLLGDVDGDGKAEVCVRSGRSFLCDTGRDGGRAELSVPFGEKGDIPLLGDLDGDGRDNFWVYRNGRFFCGSLMIEFGEAGDQPVLGDFDGDGDDDPCVFRKGRFLCDTAHDGGAAEADLAFGGAGDRPLLGNLDGL